MYIMLAGAIINLALNLVLIPKFGIEAAAATTLVSSLFVIILSYIVMKQHDYERHISVILLNGALFVMASWGGFEALTAINVLPGIPALRFLLCGVSLTLIYSIIGWALGIIRPAEIGRYLTKDQN